MTDGVIFRCSDGHLYSAAQGKSLLLSVHLGAGSHLQRCPVDGRWRRASRVSRNDLSDQQIAEAGRHRF